MKINEDIQVIITLLVLLLFIFTLNMMKNVYDKHHQVQIPSVEKVENFPDE